MGAEPYYQDGSVTLYHGDCRAVLPGLAQPECCVTDPVWPNSVFPGVPDPERLFGDVCELLRVRRLVVHLGCGSDPRFLRRVPARYPFLRVVWLRYARPSYRGRLLVGSDVGYVFGEPPEPRPGRRVMAGEAVASNNATKLQHTGRGNGSADAVDYGALAHPAPRRLEHVKWLVARFADASVLDPFAGTGTTLAAAKALGVPSIGIEVEERYCEIAAQRCAQEALKL